MHLNYIQQDLTNLENLKLKLPKDSIVLYFHSLNIQCLDNFFVSIANLAPSQAYAQAYSLLP
jgi:hypothetical protein